VTHRSAPCARAFTSTDPARSKTSGFGLPPIAVTKIKLKQTFAQCKIFLEGALVATQVFVFRFKDYFHVQLGTNNPD